MSSSTSAEQGDGRSGLEFCYEVQFMVAQERTGCDYDRKEDDCDDDLVVAQWACPADEKDYYSEILKECESVFTDNSDEKVVVRNDEELSSERAWKADESSSWILQPCRRVLARDGCPPDYDWHGVSLRTPFFGIEALSNASSPLQRGIQVLRMSVRMHVNSNSNFNVFVRTGNGQVELTQLKMLATFVWMIEKEMLLPICPPLVHQASGRALPITTHAALSALALGGIEASRPQGALAEVVDDYLPDLHDAANQERLQWLWECSDLDELLMALGGDDKQPLAFGLERWCDPDAGSSDTTCRCVAAFRYATWHPYDELDVTDFWIELCLSICGIMYTKREKYKSAMRAIETAIRKCARDKVPEDRRWKILMTRLGLREDWHEPLAEIVDEYRPGGKLAPEVFDQQPRLGLGPGLDRYHLI